MNHEEDIRARILKAEGLAQKDRPPERRYKWLKTYCPFCQNLVEYAPKEYFRGALKCQKCGKEFKLTRLTDFAGEEMIC